MIADLGYFALVEPELLVREGRVADVDGLSGFDKTDGTGRHEQFSDQGAAFRQQGGEGHALAGVLAFAGLQGSDGIITFGGDDVCLATLEFSDLLSQGAEFGLQGLELVEFVVLQLLALAGDLRLLVQLVA